MTRKRTRWVKITRLCKNELVVDTINSGRKGAGIVQSEQGAMIEVGAVIGATVLALGDGDCLKIVLDLTRKKDWYD